MSDELNDLKMQVASLEVQIKHAAIFAKLAVAEEMESLKAEKDQFKAERDQLLAQAEMLAEAIAAFNHTPFILGEIDGSQIEIQKLANALTDFHEWQESRKKK